MSMEPQAPTSAPTRSSIEISVNGEKCLIPEACTVAQLIDQYGLDPSRVAVELDRRIVRQPERANIRLHAGAEVEIVQFVGGG